MPSSAPLRIVLHVYLGVRTPKTRWLKSHAAFKARIGVDGASDPYPALCLQARLYALFSMFTSVCARQKRGGSSPTPHSRLESGLMGLPTHILLYAFKRASTHCSPCLPRCAHAKNEVAQVPRRIQG